MRENKEPVETYHKEERQARIVSAEIDRKNLPNFLKTCIRPLGVHSHQDKTSLCNVCNGHHAPKFVHVNKSLQLGSKQMKEFEAALPQGCYNIIQKTVVNMKETKTK